MKKLSFALALVLAASLFLTACGGGSSSSSAGSTAPASDSGTAPADSGSDAPAPADDGTVYGIVSAYNGPEKDGYIYSYMAKEINERSGGRINMEVFYNGELTGMNREQLEMARENLIQWQTVPAFEFFTQSPLLANFLFFDLPFVFDNNQQFYDFCDGDFVKEKLYPQAEDALGIKLYSAASMGNVQVGTTKTPITDASSLKNLKIRTSMSEIYVAMVSSWGAAPTAIEYAECYTALTQGAIDGMTTGANLFVSSKLEEPLNHVARLDAIPFNHFVFMNGGFYNGLPEDLRTLVDEVTGEAIVEGRKSWDAADEAAWDVLRENCEIHELTPEQKATFVDPAKAIWESNADTIGRDFVVEALALLGKSL